MILHPVPEIDVRGELGVDDADDGFIARGRDADQPGGAAGGGIVYGWIEATPGCEKAPALGLIAHMDTSPEASGDPARWRVIDYRGGDIVLNEEKGIVLTLDRFPEVAKYAGEKLVVTDGTTLLGADDKAGVAALMQAAKYFADHPEVPHARLCFCVTPDEEVGLGTADFRREEFGADYAYTIDGGEIGALDTETLNAALVTAHFEGLNTHPGSAKNKMVNAIRMATDFISRFPSESVPEKTSGYEGFFHPVSVTGSVGEAEVRLLIRDHDNAKFEDRKAYARKVGEEMNRAWGGRVTVTVRDQYYNLSNYLEDFPVVTASAREAMKRAGVEIVEEPVRGGTDGCRISSMGLPTPNFFAGGLFFHSVYECLPVKSLDKAYEVARTLCEMSAEIRTLR
ncbi:peptidase T [Sutterella sp.]|uniref:peptidase T n=1 Tax=Sutterella sp. TaxID=1981025 RepID=UPI0026E0F742|nr:peptidase T [Sutterella sp.]MDO5530774.1 peptidase T [Sutterella sp.]